MTKIIRKVVTFTAILFCILLVIFGFEFASLWTGIIFAVLLCAISLPLEIFASATFAALSILDYFMNDVSILPISAFIIALIIALFSLTDFQEKLLKKEDNGLLVNDR